MALQVIPSRCAVVWCRVLLSPRSTAPANPCAGEQRFYAHNHLAILWVLGFSGRDSSFAVFERAFGRMKTGPRPAALAGASPKPSNQLTGFEKCSTSQSIVWKCGANGPKGTPTDQKKHGKHPERQLNCGKCTQSWKMLRWSHRGWVCSGWSGIEVGFIGL